MPYRILTDENFGRVLTIGDAVRKVEAALLAKAEGRLVAPPRFHVDVDGGSLVFTAGAETSRDHVIGFRVYSTFRNKSRDTSQFTAVFDSETGAFKGIVIGDLVGGVRTGSIGGVAIKHMSRPDSRRLGILGTGFQARSQFEAAASTRDFEAVDVYSPTAIHREAFAAEMGAKSGLSVKAVTSPAAAVGDADVLICASNRVAPIFEADWLRPGTHINAVGPKLKGAHEIPMEAVERSSVVASDSLAQVDGYSPPFFLSDTPHRERMVELSDIVSGRKRGRTSDDDITLFCSVGLAGTEVVVANEALQLSEV